MPKQYTIIAKKRVASKQSTRESRNAGLIPGVLYGYQTESSPVAVDYSEFLRLFRQAGQSSVIELEVEGKKVEVLIHAYNLDPVQGDFRHVDFLAINPKAMTMVHVPLVFEGESGAVKNLGGTFMSNHSALDIRCLPKEIPHEIKINIASLEELHDHVTISDLNLPESLEVMHLEPDTVLCTVTGRSKADEIEESTAEVSAEGEEAEKTEEGAKES